MESQSMSRAVRIRQGRQSCEKNLHGGHFLTGRAGKMSGSAENVQRDGQYPFIRQNLSGESERNTDQTGRYELTGRIVVAAGIFLLLFFGGRVLKEPSRETVQSWILADPVKEKAVPEVAAWAEERLSEMEKGN